MKLLQYVVRGVKTTRARQTHCLGSLNAFSCSNVIFRSHSVRSFSIAREQPPVVDPANILRPQGLENARKQYSLVDELPGLPTLKPASQLLAPQTEITTLSNGIRVISHETYGQAATVGVFINAGSRCESAQQAGVTHALEHFGFKSTSTRPHAQLVREVEDIGALTTSSCGREQIIYTIDVLRDNVEKAVELLADAVLNVQISEQEFEQIKQIMEIQTENVMEDPQAYVLDAIHAAAYGTEQALGRPLQCPLNQIDSITLDTVMEFRKQHFVANNMVVAGSGIDHSTLCTLVEKRFGMVPTMTSRSTSPPPAIYQGGMTSIPKENSDFSYVSIAFPTHGGWHDQDLVPVCVLHTLLGGGDSFSAGGPGKGMYSRLYTQVLNRYYWVESAFSFSSIHEDVGLLGIYAASDPDHTSNLVALVCNQLYGLTQTLVGDMELLRAKNQLKSSVLMNLESRMILYEDIGRQLLTYGQRESPESVCAKIDAVTAQDLQRVMQQAMRSPPSMVIHGDLSKFPSYEQVCVGLQGALAQGKEPR